MATNPKTLHFQDVRSRRRLSSFDVSLIRWAIGVGGVVALLALAAMPGPAPEMVAPLPEPGLTAEQPASPVMDGRGKWTGYSSMAHEWRQAPAVTPGGWSAPVEIAH
jgi:hypothetical protein